MMLSRFNCASGDWGVKCVIKSLTFLRLTSTLVKTTFDFATLDFLKESGIKHYRIPIPAHKDGQKIAMMDIAQIMRILTNPCNQPMLVHCNKGKVSLLAPYLRFIQAFSFVEWYIANYCHHSSTVLAALSLHSVDLPSITTVQIGLLWTTQYQSKPFSTTSSILQRSSNQYVLHRT